jgi:putative transposase
MAKRKRVKVVGPQKSLSFFDDTFKSSEEESRHISHENHIEDSKLFKEDNQHDFTFDFIDFDDELKKIKKEDLNLRAEIIYIDDPYYNKIFSILCGYSKLLSNSSTYEIKQSQMKNFDKNGDGTSSTKEQKELRLKISDILEDKKPGYQTDIYELLDKYFRTSKDENYTAIPRKSAQQTIKLATDALFSNEQSKSLYNVHPWDYTGKPGDLGYKKEGHGCIRGESIAIFTNQQCSIEKRSRPKNQTRKNKNNKEGSFYDSYNPFIDKNCLTFPPDLRKTLKIDTLSVDPIITRLSNLVDLRQVRIIPLYIGYKIEIVYRKVIPEKLQKFIDKFKDVSKDRYMGIDIGVNNTMGIGCLDVSQLDNIRMIGNHPILIKGQYLKSINQWFNKMTSELYSMYMKQQGGKRLKLLQGKESKGTTVKMGKKFKILSQNRDNFFKDTFHKLSHFVITYCVYFKIGTIIIDWSKGIKQNANMGKVNNQNFAYIPFSTKLIRMIKYKARLFGIKTIIQNGSYTSLSSFPDNEPFDETTKNIKDGGLKPDNFGRISRGLFITNKGLKINDDIMSSFNQIRKYLIAIGKPIVIGKGIPNIEKINGVVGGMLHPICLEVKKLLSEGSRFLISRIDMNRSVNNVKNYNN